jgi:choline-sulfatase
MNRPNILLIFTDQHRLSAVGAYGETPCRTPNIDRLAQEGTLFKNAYTVYPVCSPARATILTGLYPHSHGITSNIHEVGCSIHELEDRPGLLPRRLQAAGYNTGYTGKWHLGTYRKTSFGQSNKSSMPSDMGFRGQNFPGHGEDGARFPEYVEWLKNKGFEHGIRSWQEKTKKVRKSIGEIDLPTDATVPAYLVDNSIELIKGFNAEKKPFYMSLNFWGPHGPYYATKEFVDLYRDKDIPPWPNFDWDSRGITGPHHYKVHWDKEKFSWEDWATAVRYYYARTSMIDDQIGRLHKYLEDSGQLENTIIIFSADHGETLGSHGGLLDKGWHHFEETHRVPMIIRMPGENKNQVREELVSLADIFPTIMDMTGSPVKENEVHGRSLVPLVQGKKIKWRDEVVTEFLGLNHIGTCMKTIRKGDLKYGYNLTYKGELYDLKNDPHETRNLIDDPEYADRLQTLKKRLEEWMVQTADPALRMYRWHQRISPEA